MNCLPLLDQELIESLKDRKNLLACSGGTDSTALFFILHTYNIPFDVVCINHDLRPESEQECRYVQELSMQYHKHCYIHKERPKHPNLETNARMIRYRFFKQCYDAYGYETLLTAHQLNDRLEWFLMQMSKGSGLGTLDGLTLYSEFKGMTICRPLITTSKKIIMTFLKANNIHYYHDAHNEALQFKRSYFRPIVTSLLEENSSGFERSFALLNTEKEYLYPSIDDYRFHDLLYFTPLPSDEQTLFYIDRFLKQKGYLLSAQQRYTIAIQKHGVVGGKWAFDWSDRRVWIAPYLTHPMPKTFKEQCRRLNIPPKIRPYLFTLEDENVLWDSLGSSCS